MKKEIKWFLFFMVLMEAGLCFCQKPIENGQDGDVVRAAINTNFDTLYVSNVLMVSESKGYTSIQSAIDAATSGDVVKVYPGVYDESISLKNGVDIIGVGDAVIDYDADNSTPSMIADGDTLTISGVTILRSDPSTDTENINSNLSNIIFVNCIVGDFVGSMPMVCDSSELRFINTDILTMSAARDSVSVTGNSRLIIEGGTMTGNFIFRNTSKLRGSVHSWYSKNVGNNSDAMIVGRDDADIEIFIQSEAKIKNRTTFEIIEGTNVKEFMVLYNNAIGKVSGNEIQLALSTFGNSTLYMSNVTASSGESRVVGNDSATIVINNWRSVMDVDNNIAGLHNVETFSYTGEMTIRNSHIEFTGYSGGFETMGNPIVVSEGTNLKMYATTVIDHNNDNDGGENYPGVAFFKSETELHNCTFRQINSDGLFNTKRTITLNGDANWRVLLDNVHLENDASSGVGLYLETYDPVNDTLILKGVTMDVNGTQIYGPSAETFSNIIDFSSGNFGVSYFNQSHYKNIYVQDTIVQSTMAHYFQSTETKEKLYKTVLSDGVYGDNSGRVYSDDTLEVTFNFLRPLNHAGGKYWVACDGKFFLTHYSAGVETGEVWEFDMAAANDTAYHTATEKYDFTSAANYTFTAGEVTDYSYKVYITSTADFKAYAYWYDLMNIKSVLFAIIDND